MSNMKKFEKYLLTDWMIDLNFGLRQLSIALSNEEMGFSAVKAALDQAESEKMDSVAFLNEKGSVISESEIQEAHFGKVTVQGTMRSQDGLCSYGIMHQVKALRQMNANDGIKGVLIEMDTGGGESTAAAMLKGAVKELVDNKKPVIIYAHNAMSGGIYSTVNATEIIASDVMAKFGSVGVMMSMNKEILTYIKENVIMLYSENSENKNKGLRELLKDPSNPKPIIEELTKLDESFMSEVSRNRPLKGSDTRKEETLSGSVFTAKEAKRRGLIDNIGTYQYAINKLKMYSS